MFYCYVRYYRVDVRPYGSKKTIEQFHMMADDEKTIRKIGCALSGLLKQMDIEHDIEFVYRPYMIDRKGAEDND